MIEMAKSVLIVGFNTRPLAFSLNKAGYEVYAVDFFGDIDLYPNVKDCMILTKTLNTNYSTIKENYSGFLAQFSIDFLKKHPKIDYLLIGSGLDDALKDRKHILDQIAHDGHVVFSLNNKIQNIAKARDIGFLYQLLTSKGYNVPKTQTLKDYLIEKLEFNYPFILKKRTGSGGTSVYKINKDIELDKKLEQIPQKELSNWLIQEYLEGVPISCTVISDGEHCEIISINRQIIGLGNVNAPKQFIYCGNVVPGNIRPGEEELVKKISIFLTLKLKLIGINGFDYVLKNNYPFLMEINPRIPGSIRASEEAMQLNLLHLHVLSFTPSNWNIVSKTIRSAQFKNFVTKLIFFAPKTIGKNKIKKINELEYIHDKTEPMREIHVAEPVCTVLYKDKDFSSSYFEALKIIDKIYEIIQ